MKAAPVLLAVLGLFFSLSGKAKEAPLRFPLPDQTEVTGQAEPPLEQRKLSQLTLNWPSSTTWKLKAFDALMPTHKHGMIVQPSQPIQVGAHSYRFDGVKLHMPGTWILRLQIEDANGKQQWVEVPRVL